MLDEPWPIVTDCDPGIRPAGPRDACLYCKSKIGEMHGLRCIVVCKKITMHIFINQKLIGIWTTYVPHYWTQQDCESFFNQSSWCASNLIDKYDEIEWYIYTNLNEIAIMCGCLCPALELKFGSIIDNNPILKG